MAVGLKVYVVIEWGKLHNTCTAYHRADARHPIIHSLQGYRQPSLPVSLSLHARLCLELQLSYASLACLISCGGF